MVQKPTTVARYLASLPPDRRAALQAVRKVILENLDADYEEGIQYGMISYYVPHSVYPQGYHCDPSQPLPYASIASQKNHMAVHLFCLYTWEEGMHRFQEAWLKTGRKLDMGKSCVRFKKIEDVALDVLGKTIKRTPVKRFVAMYEQQTGASGRGKGKTTAKRAGTKKRTTKKTARKTIAKKTAKRVAKKAATKVKKRTTKKKTAKKKARRTAR